jgi:hypothetical protein
MSIPAGPPPVLSPRLPPRPPAVSWAAYLLAGLTAVWLSGAGAVFFSVPHFDRAVSAQAEDPMAGSLVGVLLAVVVSAAVLASSVPLVLAHLDLKGSPTARILSWVLCGVSVLVAAVLLLGGPFAAVPWLSGLYVGVSVLTVALAAGVVVLLARPGATRYFRDTAAARRAARPAVPRYQYPPVRPDGA